MFNWRPDGDDSKGRGAGGPRRKPLNNSSFLTDVDKPDVMRKILTGILGVL